MPEDLQGRKDTGADVLIIDNDIFFTLAIIKHLKQLGLSYDHVLEADQALPRIRKHFKKYNSNYRLILVSQSMQSFNDGIDLSKAIAIDT